MRGKPADDFAPARARLRRDLERAGIRDQAVLGAMARVGRHEFVPRESRHEAYGDHPLPIGHGQTISQPYIVALMTESLNLSPGDRVLEIGTGSGYQAAVLSEMGCAVYSVECVDELAAAARDRLARLGYEEIHLRVGDGSLGWPEEAPFDAVIVTAAPETVPDALRAQLVPGGRLVVPVGPQHAAQELLLYESDETGEWRQRAIAPVRFVPLVRRH